MRHFAFFLTLLFLVTAATHAQDTANWPRFRGENGTGVSEAKNLPEVWDTETNIAWKTTIPGEGWSSPIVWGDRIFLTSTTEEGKNCHVIAIELKTGKILWDKIVFEQIPQFKHGKNSYATPTPVTDGKTVYTVFGSGGFAALDFDGNLRWTNLELDYYSQHGMGTSPVLYKNLLILAVNPSSREEPKGEGWQTPWEKSYLLALDKETGKEVWRGKRGLSRIAHSTPIMISVDGKDQILSAAGNVIQGFDPADGTLIWTVQTDGEPCVPSPVMAGDLALTAAMPGDGMKAVRVNGKGDCTETHLAWTQKRNVPMMSSFLYVKPCVYTTTDNGSFSCFNAETGEFLWQERLGGSLNPSPLYADGKFYVLSEQGATSVLKPNADPTQKPELVSKNELEEDALASIAVTGNRLVIRTKTQLWCVGK